MRIRDGAGPAPAQDTASALFGMAGVRVTEVEREAGGRVTVWAVADVVPECPGCGTVAEHVHKYVTTRPRQAVGAPGVRRSRGPGPG